ncbi:MAG: hypothetical protein Ct9H90mP3_5170 [Flammeovirgaceae bacterium]|nr:MAG: hypothetical protein Ct9H90mP3_5170 [Flammeovirgaceae bacterium]
MKKCILIVIDSLGVGAAPDAKKYGDEKQYFWKCVKSKWRTKFTNF